MKFKWLILLLFIFTIIAVRAVRARSHFETWLAWVSDENCGALHAKPGGADCIRKCRRGGASIGHPEWTAQRVVLVRDSDKTVWVIDNPSALDGREGQLVRVKVERDRSKKEVHIESVADAN